MQDSKKRFIGRIEASLTALCFGLLGVFGKLAFASGLTVGPFMAFRFTTAAVLMWIFVLCFRRNLIVQPLKQILVFLMLGVFGYAAMSVTYLKAIDGLNLTTAVLILYTYPFWVSVFSHFFTDHKITVRDMINLVVAGVGLVLLLGGHVEMKELSAVIAGLASAIIYAIYIVASEKLQKKSPPFISSLYVISFGALALLLFFQPKFVPFETLSNYQMAIIVGMAITCTILPLTLELSALQKIKSTDFSVIMLLEPISAAVWGALIFKETLSLVQILGAALIISALALKFLRERAPI